MEVSRPLDECLPDPGAHRLTHRDQLRSVVVSHDGFQDLVHDRGKNTLVVVSAKFPVDLWQVSDVWLGEHTQ